MIRTVIGLLAVIVGATACATPPTTAPASAPAEAPAVPTPDLGADRYFEQITRFGSGRAIAVAATDSVSIIATTIGVDVLRDGNSPLELSTSLAPPLADVMLAGDGRTALLIDESGAAELWSLDDQRRLRSFDHVASARFAVDGSSIDVVETGAITRVLSADGSTVSRSERTHADTVAMTAWIGPEQRAVTIGADGSSEAWDGTAVTPAAVESDTARAGRRAVGDPTGSRVVVGVAGDDRFAGSLVMLDTDTGVEIWRHDLGDGATGSTWDVGSDGRVLAVAGMDARLLGPDGEVEASWKLDGDESVVSVIALGTSGGYAIVRASGSVVFVDADGEAIAAVAGSKRLVDPTATVSTGGLVAADVDGRVRRWNSAGELVDDVALFVAGRINEVAVSPDGTTAAAASSDGNVAVLALSDTAPTETISPRFTHPEGNVDSVAFVPDGTAVVSGVSEPNGTNSFDDTLSRWDLSGDERRFAVGGIPEPIMGCTEFRNTVLVSPDGEFFVAPFHDFSVSVRRTADGSVIHEFPEHISIVWDLALSRDGRLLATSSDDWTVRVWDLDDDTLVSEIETRPGGFLAVSFLPDGETLVVSDITGNVHLVDIDSGAVTATFEGDKDPQARLAVSPDGHYVAAGSGDDGPILVWETSTGTIVQEIGGHEATVTSVRFTPDGLGLVSGSADGTVRLWRVADAAGE